MHKSCKKMFTYLYIVSILSNLLEGFGFKVRSTLSGCVATLFATVVVSSAEIKTKLKHGLPYNIMK